MSLKLFKCVCLYILHDNQYSGYYLVSYSDEKYFMLQDQSNEFLNKK